MSHTPGFIVRILPLILRNGVRHTVVELQERMDKEEKSRIDRLPVGARIALACVICLGAVVSIVYLVRLITR